MCGTCYDECVPAKISRSNDSESCDPLYRAGSVFYGNADYTDISDIPDCEGCSITNAGYYGKTYSVDKNRPVSVPRRNAAPTSIDHLNIPTIQDLLRGRPTELPQPQSVPQPNQTTPAPAKPAIQPKVTKKFGGVPQKKVYETGLIPAQTSAPSPAPQFNIEELRRMDNDPSVTDIRIINVEDAVDKAFR
ncbi:hypothetical protein FACS189427_01090 [Planctomycetales bacterium]|nr:hypothetical protein FACS189427_01090 [Planctomycetales bacterium]